VGHGRGTWDWNLGLELGTGTWDWNLGLELHPDLFLDYLMLIIDEIWRVERE
jgi:hypothetical protein